MHPLRGVYRNSSFKVVKQMGFNGADLPRKCGLFCLGPLAFHTGAVGDRITLTCGARCAERAWDTFRNGVVFSNRPVRVREKVRLRVDRSTSHWTGALRVGFTTIQPAHGPPADMAIPNLTKQPGYWAVPLPEDCAWPGSELQFWVNRKGRLMYRGQDGQKYQLLVGLDISRPLWAMIDLYGQTCTVALLGSEKKCLFGTKKSCPTFALPPPSHGDCWSCKKSPPSPELFENNHSRCPSIIDNQRTEDFDTLEDCVVCMSREACVILRCGHQCLCMSCANRVVTDFGTCPLCRQPITQRRIKSMQIT
ncbi:E3 ubiquitin-protein ligase NEURL3 [Anguilla anguilla]|uniref:E3 ubiquitin-protein ligase NEURL3 n=1 Tax=Anguilla anguilla TaxID=7936 RepID=UPI0015AEED7D|nr:E3 ubiquitin-protein ligase NEURL3 [Anguilla anguilla]